MRSFVRYISAFLFAAYACDACAADNAALERLFKQGSFAEVKGAAIKAIADDPADELALDFLRKADDAAKTEREAQSFLRQAEYDKAIIVLLKLKTLAPDAERLDAAIAQVKKDRALQERKAFEADIAQKIREAKTQLLAGETDQADDVSRLLEARLKTCEFLAEVASSAEAVYALKRDIADRKRAGDVLVARTAIDSAVAQKRYADARKVLADAVYKYGEESLRGVSRRIDDAEAVAREEERRAEDRARVQAQRKIEHERDMQQKAAEDRARRVKERKARLRADARAAFESGDLAGVKKLAIEADDAHEPKIAEEIRTKLADEYAKRSAELKRRAAQKAAEIRAEQDRKAKAAAEEEQKKREADERVARENARKEDEKRAAAEREEQRVRMEQEKEAARAAKAAAAAREAAEKERVRKEVESRRAEEQRRARVLTEAERRRDDAARVRRMREQDETAMREAAVKERARKDEVARKAEERVHREKASAEKAEIERLRAEKAALEKALAEKAKQTVQAAAPIAPKITYVPYSAQKKDDPKDTKSKGELAAKAREQIRVKKNHELVGLIESLKDAIALGDLDRADEILKRLARTFEGLGDAYASRREEYRTAAERLVRVKEERTAAMRRQKEDAARAQALRADEERRRKERAQAQERRRVEDETRANQKRIAQEEAGRKERLRDLERKKTADDKARLAVENAAREQAKKVEEEARQKVRDDARKAEAEARDAARREEKQRAERERLFSKTLRRQIEDRRFSDAEKTMSSCREQASPVACIALTDELASAKRVYIERLRETKLREIKAAREKVEKAIPQKTVSSVPVTDRAEAGLSDRVRELIERKRKEAVAQEKTKARQERERQALMEKAREKAQRDAEREAARVAAEKKAAEELRMKAAREAAEIRRREERTRVEREDEIARAKEKALADTKARIAQEAKDRERAQRRAAKDAAEAAQKKARDEREAAKERVRIAERARKAKDAQEAQKKQALTERLAQIKERRAEAEKIRVKAEREAREENERRVRMQEKKAEAAKNVDERQKQRIRKEASRRAREDEVAFAALAATYEQAYRAGDAVRMRGLYEQAHRQFTDTSFAPRLADMESRCVSLERAAEAARRSERLQWIINDIKRLAEQGDYVAAKVRMSDAEKEFIGDETRLADLRALAATVEQREKAVEVKAAAVTKETDSFKSYLSGLEKTIGSIKDEMRSQQETQPVPAPPLPAYVSQDDFQHFSDDIRAYITQESYAAADDAMKVFTQKTSADDAYRARIDALEKELALARKKSEEKDRYIRLQVQRQKEKEAADEARRKEKDEKETQLRKAKRLSQARKRIETQRAQRESDEQKKHDKVVTVQRIVAVPVVQDDAVAKARKDETERVERERKEKAAEERRAQEAARAQAAQCEAEDRRVQKQREEDARKAREQREAEEREARLQREANERRLAQAKEEAAARAKETEERVRALAKKRRAAFDRAIAESDPEAAKSTLVTYRTLGSAAVDVRKMEERLDALTARVVAEEKARKDAADAAEKTRKEQERVRLQAEREAERRREEAENARRAAEEEQRKAQERAKAYRDALTVVKKHLSAGDLAAASAGLSAIAKTHTTDQEYVRLGDQYRAAKEEADRVALAKKRQYLEDLRRTKAEEARVAALAKAVNEMLSSEEYDRALAQLDAVRDEITDETAIKRLDDLVASVRTAYAASRDAQRRKREQVFAEQRASFDTALASGDIDKARRVLSLLKTVYGDMQGASDKIAESEIALRAAEKRAADAETAKHYAAAVAAFESAFAADELVAARAALQVLERDHAGRGDFRAMNARLAAREKSRAQEAEAENARRFEQGSKDVEFFIAQDDFLKAKIELENMKNLYASNRVQAKRIADLEARLKNAARSYEKTVIDRQFDEDIASARAALAADDCALARTVAEKMRLAYTDRRAEIDMLDEAIREKETLRRQDTIRKRDARFGELSTDLDYFVKKEQFDRAEKVMTEMTDQFASDRAYAGRVETFARMFASKRGAYLARLSDERFRTAKNDAEYLIRTKEYRKAKERLLALSDEFPQRDEVAMLLVSVERAMIDERTQQKERVRRQADEVRSRKDADDARALEAARAALVARLSDARSRIDAAVSRDDFAAAYAVLDELSTAMDPRLKPALAPLEDGLRAAEASYVARMKGKRSTDAAERLRAFDAAVSARSFFRAEVLLDAIQADFSTESDIAPKVDDARKRLRAAADDAKAQARQRVRTQQLERIRTLVSRGLRDDAEKAVNEYAAQFGEDAALKKVRKDIYRSASAQNKG
jgi:hypothetical protein